LFSAVKNTYRVQLAGNRSHCQRSKTLNEKRQGVFKELQGKILKGSVLCTDGFRSYIKFAQGNDLIHKRLDVAVKVIEKVFHIQNVNAYQSRLKAWMDRFHGVATKYLENYLVFFRFLDTNENSKKQPVQSSATLSGNIAKSKRYITFY
jgi:IS1 family transposase